MKKYIVAILVLFTGLQSYSRIIEPAKWSFSYVEKDKNVYELTFEAKIDKGWHIYGQNIEDLPIATSFVFNTDVNILEDIAPVTPPMVKYDSAQEMTVESFENKAVFKTLVEVKDKDISTIEGTLTYSACNDVTCTIPIDVDFSFDLPQKTDLGNLWGVFLLALIAGLGAILTPCVFPIIPLTVSYFMRSNVSRSKSILQGVFYGLSIVLIYTSVGFISGLLRIDLARMVSSSPVVNLIFFFVFVILAVSFFGAFEIVIPGNIGNKIDQQADKKGFLLGAFFMALATTIISFSCTGPIVGLVLGNALRGDLITPVVGMFGFGLTCALPFTLLAIFPKAIEKLPKSGGWLNSVKVTMAFILLISSLIFLSNAGFGFITRDMILITGIVLFILLGFYLMGKFRFAHDTEVKHISIVRFFFIVASFSIAGYLIPGVFGATIKVLEPFLPAKQTLSLDLTSMKSDNFQQASDSTVLCGENPKYADKFYMPYHLKGYFDYEEGLACAKELDKPVLLNFTGKYCKNCKKMYASVWSDPEVLKILNEDYILIFLYADVNDKLPESEWYTSDVDGKLKKTIGRKNADLEQEKFGSNSLPLYAITDTKGDVITKQEYYTYNTNIDDFISFLKEGKKNYKPVKKKKKEPVTLDFGR